MSSDRSASERKSLGEPRRIEIALREVRRRWRRPGVLREPLAVLIVPELIGRPLPQEPAALDRRQSLDHDPLEHVREVLASGRWAVSTAVAKHARVKRRRRPLDPIHLRQLPP